MKWRPIPETPVLSQYVRDRYVKVTYRGKNRKQGPVWYQNDNDNQVCHNQLLTRLFVEQYVIFDMRTARMHHEMNLIWERTRRR